MRPSLAVTLAAMLLLLGSGFMVFVGLIVVFGMVLVSLRPAAGLGSEPLLAGAVFAAPGMLGLTTGIGLLRRRPWARVSVLLIGSILCLIAVCVGSSVLFGRPLVPPHAAANGEGLLLGARLFLGTLYLLLFALGAWWLYLFNRGPVKAEFRPGSAARHQG
jgi:hypothetical protein